jgi:aminoglycoside phosphotransferase (APT) family kinase protein
MEETAALEAWLAEAAGADGVSVLDAPRLAGGAIQENRHLTADIAGGAFAGRLDAVLRLDAPTQVAVSRGRAAEFALLKRAFDGGVTVPEPLWLCEDASVLGGPFFVMRRVAGDAAGHRLVKAVGDDEGAALVTALGRELATIHGLSTDGLDFLDRPTPDPRAHAIQRLRGYLDELATPRPALEWGLRWLERRRDTPGEAVLAHHDFRTGNIMIADGALTGILDWEFAGLAEREEDIAWFCAKCWRFGRIEREAGGLGPRAAFYDGYEKQSGVEIDRAKVRAYEVLAHARWAVIAAQQAERFTKGGEENLELALTGHVVPELELEVLRMTAPRPAKEAA